jgi:hypothetical protein
MKNVLKVFIISFFLFPIFSCGKKNPAAPQPVPPVPKPSSSVEAAAFAAKKADYFIRLAFDLADGYLYNNSVAKKRYGTDSNYVNSLNFDRAYSEGIITSRDLGTFEFWYYRDREDTPIPPHTYDVVITSYALSGQTDSFQKRQTVVNAASANHPAKRFNIRFTGADTGSDDFTLDVWYSSEGFDTGKGAEIFAISPPMSFTIEDSSGTSNSFTASFSNIKGKIKDAASSYNASPSYEFVIEEGTLVVSGLGYSITLIYSGNKAQGIFTGSDGFSAVMKLNEDNNYGAYFIVDSFPDITRHVGWDFP